MGFRSIDPEEIKDNPFRLVGKDWLLVTAGDLSSFNTMTASWGTLGVLWGKQVSFCFVRPSRYTYEFMEKADFYTLSALPAAHRDALTFCGTYSGRDVDKVEQTGLHPVDTGHGTVSFEEARLVLVCRKIYHQDMDPSHFLDASIESNYSGSDYHRIYVGEVTEALVQ
jgi:flavin reductase (DIM6/NTAB) family NADH-FMN oxidoreductase RutF